VGWVFFFLLIIPVFAPRIELLNHKNVFSNNNVR
jgi:hypothetical protein